MSIACGQHVHGGEFISHLTSTWSQVSHWVTFNVWKVPTSIRTVEYPCSLSVVTAALQAVSVPTSHVTPNQHQANACWQLRQFCFLGQFGLGEAVPEGKCLNDARTQTCVQGTCNRRSGH